MADRNDWPRDAFGGGAESAPNDLHAKYHAAILRLREAAILNIGPSIADVVLVHNYAESRPGPAERLTAWLSMGPTVMADEPAIFMDSPTDGDPLILATMKRVHREDMLHAALRGTDLSATIQWIGTLAAAINVIDGLKAQMDAAQMDARIEGMRSAIAACDAQVEDAKPINRQMAMGAVSCRNAIRLLIDATVSNRVSAAPAHPDTCTRPDCPSGDGLICPDCAKREGGAA